MYRCFLATIFLLIISACSKKGLIYLNVQEPPQVAVPKNTLKLGVVNRTLPSENSKLGDEIEKILTVEGKNLDQDGSNAAIEGFYNAAIKNDRFKEVKILDLPKLRTLGMGVFPGQLSFGQVNEICKNNHVDALVVLEFFDTNSKINFTTSPTTVNTPLGNVPALMHNANLNTIIQMGWRIYDKNSQNVIDEYHQSQAFNFHSSGVNPLAAFQAISNRKATVNQYANEASISYFERLIPFWIRVNREYYIKGNDQMVLAKRRAQAGNWDGAAEIWKEQSTNSNPKIAGRACHNYAIIQEINGDLDSAIKWAQKAYEDYNDKISLNYVNILRNRKQKLQHLGQ